jgi:hypothetical protein
LGHIDNLGEFTMFAHGFNPGSGGYWAGQSKLLFVTDNHYIVRELTQISVVKKGESTKKSILLGYNVISISVKGDKVFFIAEDNLGNKKTGFYSLTTEETIFVITQEEFNEIFTF